MDSMNYAEELVREFLIFRGFTSTLQAYESELSTDIGKHFQIDRLVDLVFSQYIPKYQAEKLLGLLKFLKQFSTPPSDTVFVTTLVKLELSILRYYIVNALKFGRQDKVIELFGANGNYFLHKRDDWLHWFALPYIRNPSLDPQFRVYFSKEWLDTLILSFRNFLSDLFSGSRIPMLMKLSTEKSTIKDMKNDLKQLNNKLSELQALLEIKDAEISQLQSKVDAAEPQRKDSFGTVSNSSQGEVPGDVYSRSYYPDSAFQTIQAEDCLASIREEDFPDVKVHFQETFLGHASSISRCRFSTSGANIASASHDGTVRIWSCDSAGSSRNATIYCGSEVTALGWECKSDRLLLMGTTAGGIKAWNAEANRVICDLNMSKNFPSILDLKCSPVEPIFVSAAASKRPGINVFDKMEFAQLTVWDMKKWKASLVLPVGKDPPAITSICFNHNGKILAASAIDGMVHMFDMSAGLPITGWPAHDGPVASVLFSPAETSIFSLGADGKIFEWSLQNQGKTLWSRDCSRFCNLENLNKCRHEMAIDSIGSRLLVTSGLVRSPIYQIQGHLAGFKTLPHAGAITSVDWHPTSPMFVTGSADHSVRVTSIT